MNKEKCNWHNPDKEGKYSCTRAQITLHMELGGTEAAKWDE